MLRGIPVPPPARCTCWAHACGASPSPRTLRHTAHPLSAMGLEVKVWRAYEDFIAELSSKFPHEREGIRK